MSPEPIDATTVDPIMNGT
jgi:hypothetical protein